MWVCINAMPCVWVLEYIVCMHVGAEITWFLGSHGRLDKRVIG